MSDKVRKPKKGSDYVIEKLEPKIAPGVTWGGGG